MNAYEIPDAIQWHEGLLLTPQHFQQLSSRHEALVQYGTSLFAPFCWGVRRFKHHAISLPAGKLRVLELEAVMPDGLVVVHGLHDTGRDEVLEIDLSAQAEEIGDRGALVQLVVAADTTVMETATHCVTNRSKAMLSPTKSLQPKPGRFIV